MALEFRARYCEGKTLKTLLIACRKGVCKISFDGESMLAEYTEGPKEYVDVVGQTESIIELYSGMYLDSRGRPIILSRDRAYIIRVEKPLWRIMGLRSLNRMLEAFTCGRMREKPPSLNMAYYIRRIMEQKCFESFRSSELVELLGVGSSHAYVLAHRMVERGALLRLHRSRYMVNPEYVRKYAPIIDPPEKCFNK